MTGRPEDQAKTAVEKLLSYEFVCKLKDIPEGSRKCMLLPSNQRSILLINLQNTLYCIDQTCYRKSYFTHRSIE
jgi:nitrite reductase/ring-hydroxylating ferredoxin subunit